MTIALEQDPQLVVRPFELPEKRIIVDHERVNLVLGQLVTAYTNNTFPYNLDTTRLPHDPRHMPETLETGGVDHAMFLWSVCYYMRGGTKSNNAVIRLSQMYDQRPDLFVASEAKQADPEDIAASLTLNGLGFQEKISKSWVENARRMDEKWDGDPRNIYEDIDTYQECLDRIANDKKGGGFIGFQKKMTSMINYYLMDSGLVEYFDFPLPVDLHVARLAVSNELFLFDGYREPENVLSEELLDMIRQTTFEYAVKNDISILRLCDALWLLSEALCGIQPGNITKEPLGREKRKGRKTLLVPLYINLEDRKQIRDYNRSCAQCPVEPTCKWNVPGAVYYIQGDLIRRRKRIRDYPQEVQQDLFIA